MSFQGQVETQCPDGCEPFDTPIWSFVHGGNSPDLREAVKAAECNLLLCPSCSKPFHPIVPWIYYEPAAEILAFVFPETYRAEADKWRDKMNADFETMRGALGDALPVGFAPTVYFGQAELSEVLEGEDWRAEEREVMEHYARELGLNLYLVSRSHARDLAVPSVLPFVGAKATRASVLAGIAKLIAANDRLAAWSDFAAKLEKNPSAGLPPESTAPRKAK